MFCGLTTQPVLFIENPAVLKLLLKMFKRKKHCSPSHRWKHIQKINRLRVWEWKTRHSAAKPCNISGPMSSSTVTQTVVKDRLLILFKIILKTSLQPFLFTFQRTGCHFKLSKGLALWRWWRLPCLPTSAITNIIFQDWNPNLYKQIKAAATQNKTLVQGTCFEASAGLIYHKIKLFSLCYLRTSWQLESTLETLFPQYYMSFVSLGFFQYARKIPELHNNRERQNMSKAFKESLDLWLVAFWPLLEPCF